MVFVRQREEIMGSIFAGVGSKALKSIQRYCMGDFLITDMTAGGHGGRVG
jgi:hypothetical protein